MIYTIRHTTRFRYSAPVCESVMELRMKPRNEGQQRCLDFSLDLTPTAPTHAYDDFLGNVVHHFNIPSQHTNLEITMSALVERSEDGGTSTAVGTEAWKGCDELKGCAEYWDWLEPSHFARPSEKLTAFADELDLHRRDDPLTVLADLNADLHRTLTYDTTSTAVDSPIDVCLDNRSGVCQDFAHLFIALARGLNVPCRYVSGYLFHRPGEQHTAEDATHAWAEAYLPGTGWLGFDPSNNSIADSSYIRVAVGRDYLDVPPNKGVFKGSAETELAVNVDVSRH